MVGAIGRLIQSVILGVLALFKRLLCVLNRKRHNSETLLPIHHDSKDIPQQILTNDFPTVVQSNAVVGLEAEDAPEEDFQEWGSWDNPSKAQKLQQLNPAVDVPEVEPDYFQDLGLAPSISTQKKLLLSKPIMSFEKVSTTPNRLAFVPDAAAIPMSAELGEWDESSVHAWEDDDLTLEAESTMRQSRKVEREKRLAEHQMRKLQREAKKHSLSNRTDLSLLATKLS